ncbi:MAG: amidohydrolase family protein [Pseudomonadota bacterium]
MMRVLAALISTAIALAACHGVSEPPTVYDVQISGGLVFDGTSKEGRVADIFVEGDRIVFIGDGDTENVSGEVIIDATGLIVAPGFIDPHTHTTSDVLFSNTKKRLEGYLTQGVTTVVSGNDGQGPFDIAGTLRAVDARGVGPNFALFTGHGSIRSKVLGRENREPTPEELDQMRALTRTAIEDGALGLSAGLYYAPASYATTEEVIELAKVAGEFGAIYDTHIRDESTYSVGLLAAVEEAIEISRQSGAPLHLAHIKALGVDVWGYSADVIAAVEAAQAEGIRVTADQYPWSASGTRISNALIPNWAKADSDEAMNARLRDPANQARLVEEITENLRKRGGADAILLVARANDLPSQSLTAEAAQRGLDPVQTAIQIVLEGDSRIASFNMEDGDIERFMVQPWVMTSSDGTNGHPRKFASFPRKYRTYVVEKKVISLVDFINRSTSFTADTMALCDRGRLRPGKVADIVIFDPDRFGPVADFSHPALLSEGVVHLLVNGEFAIRDGALSEELYGLPLRRGACDQEEEQPS